jgi:protein TonB
MAPQSNTSTSRPIVSDGFERCMVEADPAARSTRKTILRRSMAVSILLECLAVAVAILWPLFSTYPLVAKSNVPMPIPPYGPPRLLHQSHPSMSGARPPHGLTLPTTVVFHPPTASTPRHPFSSDPGSAPDLPGGQSGTDPGSNSAVGIIDLGDNRFATEPPLRPIITERPPAPAVIRRSEGVQAAMLIRRVEPLYPPIARQTRIQGTVQLHAVIARDGSIASLEALSGHPLLIRAALDAVRQWRYRPTLLGSEPVEVETYITVIFKLGDN